MKKIPNFRNDAYATEKRKQTTKNFFSPQSA